MFTFWEQALHLTMIMLPVYSIIVQLVNIGHEYPVEKLLVVCRHMYRNVFDILETDCWGGKVVDTVTS